MAKPSLEITQLLGKRIHRITGHKSGNHVSATYILFDDKETYMELNEQDREYHDCNTYARTIAVFRSPERWGIINKTSLDSTELT